MLLSEDRTLMSVADIFQKCVDVFNASRYDKSDFLLAGDAYIHTNDMIAFHPSGDCKIVHGCDAAYLLFRPDAQMSDGGIHLSEDVYHSLEGITLSRKDMLGYLDRRQFFEQARENPIMDALDISEDSLRAMFVKLSTRYAHPEGMRLSIADIPEEKPSLQSWVVLGLDTGFSMESSDMDIVHSRYIGVAPHSVDPLRVVAGNYLAERHWSGFSQTWRDAR